MKKLTFTLATIFCLGFSLISQAAPYARIKDIADFEGVRSNMLIGYGIVAGLKGTGDNAKSIPFARQTLLDILEKLGVNSKDLALQLKMKNVAAVIVTADMPSYARQGARLDVNVSSLGDAKSLEGGQLIATAMVAADGKTYAIARGSINIGGFVAEAGGGTVTKNHPTTGLISGGATIEEETGHELALNENLRILLRNPDFTTALRIEKAINKAFGEPLSHSIDNGTIDITVPADMRDQLVSVIQRIENIRVAPDAIARVVVDEKTGTIVMGRDVQISEVAISHSNLTIRITELQEVVQPEGFTGVTAAVDRSKIAVDEDAGHFQILDGGLNLADLVDGLNTLGVKPRDIVSILQSIKAAGAMQAEIVMM